VTVGRPEGSSRPHACGQQSSSRPGGRTRWPAAPRSRANAVGATFTRLHRRLDGARRARFLVVCKYMCIRTSNAARARRNPAEPRRPTPT